MSTPLARLTAATDQPTLTRRERPEAPTMEWDGRSGHVTTKPLASRPTSWDDYLREAGLDPAEVEVVEPVQVRGWQTTRDGEPVWLHYYRLTVESRRDRVDIDDLVRAAKRRKSNNAAANVSSSATSQAFLIALGDLQLGKVDGDGVEGTVDRFLAATDAAVKRYRRIAKGAPIFLAHLGDCIEGFQSQGGANAWRTNLTTTEQVRLYRRLLIEQVRALSAATPSLTVLGVPGNHDEAHRPLHTYGDSWAIDSVAAVKDALDLAGGYDHVTLHAPARDELTLTVDMAGTRVGLAHGHQWRPGQACTWWAKQAHGRQPIGEADLLLSAHLHHLRIEDTGSDKTWLQVPALESESTWWRHQQGEVARPGVVTMLVGGGGWSALEVL